MIKHVKHRRNAKTKIKMPSEKHKAKSRRKKFAWRKHDKLVKAKKVWPTKVGVVNSKVGVAYLKFDQKEGVAKISGRGQKQSGRGQNVLEQNRCILPENSKNHFSLSLISSNWVN